MKYIKLLNIDFDNWNDIDNKDNIIFDFLNQTEFLENGYGKINLLVNRKKSYVYFLNYIKNNKLNINIRLDKIYKDYNYIYLYIRYDKKFVTIHNITYSHYKTISLTNETY